ncbi:MAG: hydrogenase expression/formation protein HypE [Bacteroidetes bacterium HGW-Bacteroidetes-4]|jgi:hydrogenase expression/formation protein HypE|nr:MAG: hydrogenase expression/formation protein HypE [Bacteroidetes bacterium HGW-Bacteroidetes-4]
MELACPIPISDYDRILLAHGGGGKLMHQLIEKMIFNELKNEFLEQTHDGALLPIKGNKVAFTTDSFVVNPLFFPGGNIGDLAINGTVNDLVCCGAKPLYLSLSFIIEEGLLMDDFWKIIQNIKAAALKSGVKIVTGDTKVVEKGKGDGIFINTAGIGELIPDLSINPIHCQTGDVIIINGAIAEHGIAVLSKREGLTFETDIVSDSASLNTMMEAVFEVSNKIHVLRDPTRGGLASTLNEIAQASNTGITLYEKNLPISESVKGACELLGFDPLYVANEGKIVVILPEDAAEKVLETMKEFPEGKGSCIIGKVTALHPGKVHLETVIGSKRMVDMISGEQLPRIC